MLKIELVNSEILDGVRILRGADLSAFELADVIQNETENWVDQRKKQIETERESTLRQAKEQAYSEGLDAFMGVVKRMQDKCRSLENRQHQLMKMCLESFFRDAPREETLTAAMRPVFEQLVQEESIIIAVHKDQIEAVQKGFNKLEEGIADAFKPSFQVDENAKPGYCALFTSDSVYDFSVPILIDSLLSAIDTYVGANGELT